MAVSVINYFPHTSPQRLVIVSTTILLVFVVAWFLTAWLFAIPPFPSLGNAPSVEKAGFRPYENHYPRHGTGIFPDGKLPWNFSSFIKDFNTNTD
jgi:hypothetical protein